MQLFIQAPLWQSVGLSAVTCAAIPASALGVCLQLLCWAGAGAVLPVVARFVC